METNTASMSLGPRGPLLLQDNNFLENMAHFDRERIPERVVHAKGAGAFGYFECTHDVTEFTKLSPFGKIGKKTDVSVRFSTVGTFFFLLFLLSYLGKSFNRIISCFKRNSFS